MGWRNARNANPKFDWNDDSSFLYRVKKQSESQS